MGAVLAVILTILKWVGIALLIILGVALVLLLLVLFVPVRYRVDATLPETDLEGAFPPEDTKAHVRFSWLLHLINGGLLYPERPELFVRVAVFTVFPLRKKGGDKIPEEERPEAGGAPEAAQAHEEPKRFNNFKKSMNQQIKIRKNSRRTA